MHGDGCYERGTLAPAKPSNSVEVLDEDFGHFVTGEVAGRNRKLPDLIPYNLCLLQFVVTNSFVFRHQQPSVAANNRQPLVVLYSPTATMIVEVAHIPDRVGFERR
jgi:hypothetical protein